MFDELTVEMWCCDCKEVVEVVPEYDYEVIDGRRYVSDTILECPNGWHHELQDVSHCPICGNPMGEYDDFCPECYSTGLQTLTELKERLNAKQGDLEDLVANCLGL